MIDIVKAKQAFKGFLERYKSDEDVLGFELKVVHTYHVVENAKLIAQKLQLDEEDIKLAGTDIVVAKAIICRCSNCGKLKTEEIALTTYNY